MILGADGKAAKPEQNRREVQAVAAGNGFKKFISEKLLRK